MVLIVEYLLSIKGIDINIKANNGKTVLMVAIKYKQENIAKILIEAGADINIQDKDKDKETALINAYKNGLANTVKLLVEYGAIFNKSILKTKFTDTIPQEKQEECKKIIETEIQKIENFGKIEINNKTITKETFNNNNIVICDIMQAIQNKQLKFNYKVYNVDGKQYTLLEWSIIKGHLEIFRLLINKYNFDFVNIYGYTSLFYAYLYKQPEIIRRILVQYGFGYNNNPQSLLIKAFDQLEKNIKQAEMNAEKIINGEKCINLDEYDRKIKTDKEIILVIGYGLHEFYEKSQGKSLIDLNTIKNSKKESMLEIVCKIGDTEFLENTLELYFKENEKQYFINYINKVLNIILNENSYNSKIIETIVGQMQYYNILENYCDRILDFAIKYNLNELIECIISLSKYFDETKITKEILNKFNEEDKEYIQEKIEFQKQIKKLIIWEELKPEQLKEIKTLIEEEKIFWNDKLFKRKNGEFYTLFEWAFLWGYIDIINLLINEYNINSIDKSIFNTCLYNDYKFIEKLKIIELLFKKGLNIDNIDDINFKNKEYKVFIEDQIALKDDIIEAKVDRVQELLKIDRKLNNDEIEEFKQLIVNTPVKFSYIFADVQNTEISLFEWLCKHKYNDILKLLINKINVNLADCNNCIIFFISIIKNNPEIVQYMIYKGADINYKSNRDWRAIDLAIDNNHIDIAKILLNKKGIILQDLNKKQLTRYQEAFLNACSEGWTEMVELIIKAGGVNLDYNNFFQDAIVEANKGDNFKIVEMLILSGVSVDEKLLEKCIGGKCKEVVQTELNRKKEVETWKEVLIRKFDDKESFEKIIEFLKEKKFRFNDLINDYILAGFFLHRINDKGINTSQAKLYIDVFFSNYSINTILSKNISFYNSKSKTILEVLNIYIKTEYFLKNTIKFKPNFQNLKNAIKKEIEYIEKNYYKGDKECRKIKHLKLLIEPSSNEKTPELETLIRQYNNTNSIQLLQEISDFIELNSFEFNTELDIGKEYKCTLLEWACEKGCLDIVKKLAYKDIYIYNINYIFDYHSETPWMVAYKNHHLGVADYLVQQGAIIDKEFKNKVDKEENPEKYKQEKIQALKSEIGRMKLMMATIQQMSIFKTDFNEMEEIASEIGFDYLTEFNKNLKLFSQQISGLNNELSMLEGKKQKK